MSFYLQSVSLTGLNTLPLKKLASGEVLATSHRILEIPSPLWNMTGYEKSGVKRNRHGWKSEGAEHSSHRY